MIIIEIDLDRGTVAADAFDVEDVRHPATMPPGGAILEATIRHPI